MHMNAKSKWQWGQDKPLLKSTRQTLKRSNKPKIENYQMPISNNALVIFSYYNTSI